MANEEQLAILRQGVEVWNKWREENPDTKIDLFRADLSGSNLSGVNLSSAKLIETRFRQTHLQGANLHETNFYKAELIEANLNKADLTNANFHKADLSNAQLKGADLRQAYLVEAKLQGAEFYRANLYLVNFAKANLYLANFAKANLSKADLSGADLRGTRLINTKVGKAKISNSKIYGISAWALQGEFGDQKDLIITPFNEAIITVDNIEVAQFIYLILNNQKIRHVINSLTSKTVLILGRFALPERKVILDALKNKLREFDLLPIVFDFDRPADKDFTETIKTLAGISCFVIADVTNPKSSPLELQATVPDYQIPFVPIIQEGESPFAMMANLQTKYSWVLDTISYDSLDTLIEILKPHIIDPAIKKHNEFRKIKANVPTIISGRELKDKK